MDCTCNTKLIIKEIESLVNELERVTLLAEETKRTAKPKCVPQVKKNEPLGPKCTAVYLDGSPAIGINKQPAPLPNKEKYPIVPKVDRRPRLNSAMGCYKATEALKTDIPCACDVGVGPHCHSPGCGKDQGKRPKNYYPQLHEIAIDHCTNPNVDIACPKDISHKHWVPTGAGCAIPNPCPATCNCVKTFNDWSLTTPPYRHYLEKRVYHPF